MTIKKGLILIISIIGFNTAYAQSDVVYVESIYATSTGLPYSTYYVDNILDNDRSTIWKTIKGAGPDEGIMLYFSKPTYIKNIEAIGAKGEGLAEPKYLEVYGDGRSFWSGKSIKKELSSLYIRFRQVEFTQTQKTKMGDLTYSRSFFEDSYSVGLEELILYGKDGQKLTVIPPTFINGTVEASSSLSPRLAYGPDNLMDGKKEFGWAEGASGIGKGERLIFTFDTNVSISSMKIWNGYQRSPKHFSGNARLKTFSFGPLNSDLTQYRIEDIMDPQMIILEKPMSGKVFELIIQEGYQGSKYQDLVLSEIRFFDDQKPVVLKSNFVETSVEQLRNISNPLLQEVVDRNIAVFTNKTIESDIKSESHGTRNSLILRSNNSFVLYQMKVMSSYEYGGEEEFFGDDKSEKISDGNWEIIETTDQYVKVRIFGKIYSPTTMAELYQGEISSDNVKIFQDYLTITKDKISGQKFIDDIMLTPK